MPRPRIDIFWRDRVKELTEQTPRLSSRKITEQLEVEAGKLNRADCPSEKTVRNILVEHRAAPEQERRQYRQVFWPESFGSPELPWEAAPTVLEAMRLCGEGKRLTMRAAKWLWRLKLADPFLPGDNREDQFWTLLIVARSLAVCEAAELPVADETWRGVERRLLYTGVGPPPERYPVKTTVDAAEEEDFLCGWTREEFQERLQRKWS